MNQIEDRTKIISEGLSALASIQESCHAVSTPKRFKDFAEQNSITCLDSEFGLRELNKCFEFDGRIFEVAEQFKQTGYGVWHIGSRINDLKEQGKEILIINERRNKRLLLVRK